MAIAINTKKSGKGCMTLFSGIFFIAGLIPGYIALSSVYKSLQANHWEPTPVTIISAEIKHNEDSQRVIAKYAYQYAGQSYTSDQVSFGKMADNFSSFHNTAYQQLRDHQSRQQTFNAWVNPDKPSEAVLYKKIRWPMVLFLLLFMLVFSGAGAGMYLAGLYAIKREQKQQQLKQQAPDKPWLWRPEWQQKTLSSASSAQRWLATGFAIFWNLISLPVLFMIPKEYAKGNYIVLIATLFPLVGIILIVWAIRTWRQHFRFGNSTLELKKIPLVRGQLMEATLQLPAEVPANTELQVTLNCIRVVEKSSGGKTNTRESILWQSDQKIIVPAGGGNYRFVPIRYNIPADQPEATIKTGAGAVIWRLQIDSDIPGVDYQANFELPVFTRSEEISSAEFHPQNSRSETGLPGSAVASGALIEGMRYYFPPARHKQLAFALFIMAVIFGGTGGGIIYAGHLFFGGIFALVGLLILWGVLALVLKRYEIQIHNGSLIASSGWIGLKQKLSLPGFQIKRLYLKSNMTSGNKKYYDLYLEDSNNKTSKLAANLISRRDSEALIARLKTDLGIS